MSEEQIEDQQAEEAKTPKKKSGQRAEAQDEGQVVTFTFDDEEWTFERAKANDLEFLSALDDFANDDNALAGPRAMKVLLGRDEAARFFKERQAVDIFPFVRAAGEAATAGNS
jgi:hypothetical protein